MSEKKQIHKEEFTPKTKKGMAMLIFSILLCSGGTFAFVYGLVLAVGGGNYESAGIVLSLAGAMLGFVVAPVLFCGLKILAPNEALVLTLFGKYYGTLRGDGFFFVNPFVTAINPLAGASLASEEKTQDIAATALVKAMAGKKISLKSMALSNEKQKINDQMGNPIIIGIVVIWRVANTAKAVFNVDNFKEFLSIQCDSALRNIVRLYPYDSVGTDNEKSLRGSSQEIADRLKNEIQEKVSIAGLEIQEARITHLSYSQEIAAAMLQRQQASAVVDARQMIVDGAVGMVEMALNKLSDNNIVSLDDERKAAMVSNLLVVLCGNKDAQPIVNSGSIY
ncbi:MAG: SPFH domain-containing protein [Oscillospiraceae bacterium]|nr:SPFH domain-containing protein [Oscillospiraceae bacterium]